MLILNRFPRLLGLGIIKLFLSKFIIKLTYWWSFIELLLFLYYAIFFTLISVIILLLVNINGETYLAITLENWSFGDFSLNSSSGSGQRGFWDTVLNSDSSVGNNNGGDNNNTDPGNNNQNIGNIVDSHHVYKTDKFGEYLAKNTNQSLGSAKILVKGADRNVEMSELAAEIKAHHLNLWTNKYGHIISLSQKVNSGSFMIEIAKLKCDCPSLG